MTGPLPPASPPARRHPVRLHVAQARAAGGLQWWVLRQGAVVHRAASREAAQKHALSLAAALREAGTPVEVWLRDGAGSTCCWPVGGDIRVGTQQAQPVAASRNNDRSGSSAPPDEMPARDTTHENVRGDVERKDI